MQRKLGYVKFDANELGPLLRYTQDGVHDLNFHHTTHTPLAFSFHEHHLPDGLGITRSDHVEIHSTRRTATVPRDLVMPRLLLL